MTRGEVELEPKGILAATVATYSAFVLIPLLALWSQTLKRRVAQRTAGLERELRARKAVEKKLRTSEEHYRL